MRGRTGPYGGQFNNQQNVTSSYHKHSLKNANSIKHKQKIQQPRLLNQKNMSTSVLVLEQTSTLIDNNNNNNINNNNVNNNNIVNARMSSNSSSNTIDLNNNINNNNNNNIIDESRISECSQSNIDDTDHLSLFGVKLSVFSDFTVGVILLGIVLLGFILIGLVEEGFKYAFPDFNFGWTMTAVELYIFSFFAIIETIIKETSKLIKKENIMTINNNNNNNNINNINNIQRRNDVLLINDNNANNIKKSVNDVELGKNMHGTLESKDKPKSKDNGNKQHANVINNNHNNLLYSNENTMDTFNNDLDNDDRSEDAPLLNNNNNIIVQNNEIMDNSNTNNANNNNHNNNNNNNQLLTIDEEFDFSNLANVSSFASSFSFRKLSLYEKLRTILQKVFERRVPLKFHFQIAVAMTASRGLTNISLLLLNYPTQVIFKSMKLISVMIGSQFFFLKKEYLRWDYFAALFMVFSAMLFTLGDTNDTKLNFNLLGVIVVLLSLIFDSAHSNGQEWVLNHNASEGLKNTHLELLLYSNFFSAVLATVVAIIYGEVPGLVVFLTNHSVIDVFTWFLIRVLCLYIGVSAFIVFTKKFGAVYAVTATTVRKILTVLLSYVFWPGTKTFTVNHLFGTMLFAVAMMLNWRGVVIKNQRRNQS